MSKQSGRTAKRSSTPTLQRSIITGAAALGAAASLMPGAAQATNFTVTNTSDTGAGSLRYALYQANSNPGMDTVLFDSSLSGQTITVYSQLPVYDAVNIQGLGASNLTISGNDGNRVFYIYNATDVTISSVTLTNGYYYGNAGGGAIFDYATNLTLQDCVVENSAALYLYGGFGGGVAAINASSITLSGSTLQNNYANGGGGGLVTYAQTAVTVTGGTVQNNNVEKYGGGGIAAFSRGGNITITGTTVDGNTAANSYYGGGGGLYARNSGGSMTVTGVNLTNNTSKGGGGGARMKPGQGGTATVENSTVTGNTTSNGYGGGLYLSSGSTEVDNTVVSNNYAYYAGGGIQPYETDFTISDSEVTGNNTHHNGGGIWAASAPFAMLRTTVSGNYAYDSAGGAFIGSAYYAGSGNSDVSIQGSTFNNNSAFYVGGIDIIGSSSDPGFNATLTDTTIANNSANSFVGGLYAGNLYGGTFSIESSTIVGNASGAVGGGVATRSTNPVVLHDNIVANNTDNGTGPDASGGFTANYNLIKDATGASLTGANNTTGVDPMLGALANNGGTTQTMLPAAGSPAIDAGDPAFAPPPDTDQRGAGFPRVVNGVIDLGAVEAGVNAPAEARVPLPTLGKGGRGALGLLLAALAWLGLRRRRGSGSAVLLLLAALIAAQAPNTHAASLAHKKHQPGTHRTHPAPTIVLGTIASIDSSGGNISVQLVDGTKLGSAQTRVRVIDHRVSTRGHHARANASILAQGEIAVLVAQNGKHAGLKIFLYDSQVKAQAALTRKQHIRWHNNDQ